MEKKNPFLSLLTACLFAFTLTAPAVTAVSESGRYWVNAAASNKKERTLLAELGMAIEEVSRDAVGGFCDEGAITAMRKKGIEIKRSVPLEFFPLGFPSGDEAFHDYQEAHQALRALVETNPGLVSLYSIGTSVQGRNLWAVRFNSEARNNAPSSRPGAVFMGTHHAREHLSTEIPLMLARHLAAEYGKDTELKKLMDSRDIFIIPMVNPDGAEYDIEDERYKMWRKNRRDNGGSFGVDLNRNYGFKWNTGGSSDRGTSDVYHGPSPFSEPETQAVKRFLESHGNIRTLLSFHTFSELILYPWGHTYDPVANAKDRQVFEKMARTMAQWNGYKPEQSSDLYIASGDTTDWAYGERGIFAFTFELTPKSMWSGGFYPGAGVIQSTFNANLKPCLYMIATAGNPYAVMENIAAKPAFAPAKAPVAPVRLR